MAPVFVSTLPTSCSISSSTYLCEQLFCVEEEQNMTGIFCLFCFLFLKDINDMFYFEIVLIFVFMVCSRCFSRSSVWMLHHVSRKFPSSPYRPVCVCLSLVLLKHKVAILLHFKQQNLAGPTHFGNCIARTIVYFLTVFSQPAPGTKHNK